jgi:very-short-patch-repair endonuclease
LLDEHFRSLSPIIDFSNKEFYGGRIRLMKKEDSADNCLEVNVVENAKVDLDSTRNMAEAEQVLKKIQEIIIEDNEKNPEKPVSIGVISPFRAQVELIKKAMWQVLNEDIVRKYQIEVGTAHTFQGDEKDVMILSFTVAENSHFQSLTFLQKPNLFNVAITRAKKKLIAYVSRPVESLPQGLLRSYLEYIIQYQQMNNISHNALENVDTNVYSNKMEKEIATECKKQGFSVKSNVEIAGVIVDLLIEDETNKTKVIVECDGVADEGRKIVKPVWKQLLLERCSWSVMRVTAREWHYSKKVCIDRIKQELGYII